MKKPSNLWRGAASRIGLRIVSLLLLLGHQPAANAFVVFQLEPPCPRQGYEFAVKVTEGGFGSPHFYYLLSMEESPSGIVKVVAAGTYAGFDPVMPTTLQIRLSLSEGPHRLQFFTRLNDNNELGPEVFQGTVNFVVEPASEAANCGPRRVQVSKGRLQQTAVGAPFGTPFEIVVKDESDAPVGGAYVFLDKQTSAYDFFAPLNGADMQAPGWVRTASDGKALVTGVANGDVGTYVYKVSASRANATSEDFLTLSNRPKDGTGDGRPVVEYVKDWPQHYFYTADTQEMSLLDSKVRKGWSRTGGAFLTFPSGSSRGDPVCRFYGLPSAGLDSHFFSASAAECADVAEKFARSWLPETPDAFRAYLPELATGECGAGTQSVHRMFNDRPDANHRYLVNRSIASAMAMAVWPWTAEGYGPSAVVMCAPL